MYTRCPKCGHHPLPTEQSLPAACPACGVILAKLAQAGAAAARPGRSERVAAVGFDAVDSAEPWPALLLRVPARVDTMGFRLRVALLAGFGVWGLWLIALDHRSGEMGASFIHGPLLIFHEAGHVIFRLFGEWLMVLGGTLGQLILPAVLCGALLLKNRDPFGAAIGLWFFGVSLLDVAPYMYDALDPQLVLLLGTTGEAGGHDWIYLFTSLGLRASAQRIGTLTHVLGAAVVLLALGWATWLLKRQRANLAGTVLQEE
jgi:hypothetical protein